MNSFTKYVKRYWRSTKSLWVGLHTSIRVFFRKKSNIVILVLFAVIIAFTYIYPAIMGYDRYGNIMDSTAKHLTPWAAIEKFGFSIRWIFGTGASGQSTFDSMWYGARISLSLALLCTLINFSIGIVVGKGADVVELAFDDIGARRDDAVDRAARCVNLLAGAAKSKSEARRLIEGGGVKVDDEKISDVNAPVPVSAKEKGEFVLHKGKKVHILVRLA